MLLKACGCMEASSEILEKYTRKIRNLQETDRKLLKKGYKHFRININCRE